ncbi:MAG: hypothetical protein AAFW01_09055 [Pseudomonadota bacterium]
MSCRTWPGAIVIGQRTDGFGLAIECWSSVQDEDAARDAAASGG